MRWWVFLPALLMATLLDAAFMPALAVWGHAPQTMPILLALVGLYASRESSVLAALLAGLLLDTSAPGLVAGTDAPQAVPILGPHMLAWGATMWALQEVRPLLYRRNAVTIAVTAGALMIGASLAFLAIAGVRARYADAFALWGPGPASSMLGSDALNALVTAIAAIPLGWLLHTTLRVWGFATAGPRFAFDGLRGQSSR